MGILILLVITMHIVQPEELSAQGNLYSGDGHEYYYRILQVAGVSDESASFLLRPFHQTKPVTGSHPWRQDLFEAEENENYIPAAYGTLHFHEPVLFQSVNTSLPRGNNDGAIWQGKGYNTAFTAGAEYTLGPLYVQFRPIMGMAQNREFDLGPHPVSRIRSENVTTEAGEFSYRYFDQRSSIDYVVRFGDQTHNWFDLGDSSVELRYSGLRLALSKQRIWTGPAVHTSLQFGYSAPGFRHITLGTYRPLESPIGSFEFAYIFGKQKKSDYFDRDNQADLDQSINSLFVTYAPRFIPGLSVGALRTFIHQYPVSFSEYRWQASKIYEAFVRTGLGTPGSPDGGDPDNQIASVFLRWVHPPAGVEIYAEYGRNDHNADLRDFRQQPNHHRAYTVGMIKTHPLPENRLLAIGMEITQQEAMRTTLTRGNNLLGGWYTHGRQVLGFANRGQIMGTGYGPGVNMQKIRGDLFDPRGSVSFKLARITYHNSRTDQFFEFIEEANEKDVTRTDVRNIELMAGAEVTAFLEYGIELSAALEQSFILNHHNLSGNDVTNTRFELVLRKQIRGWKR